MQLLRGVTLRRLLETHGFMPAEVAASIGVVVPSSGELPNAFNAPLAAFTANSVRSLPVPSAV